MEPEVLIENHLDANHNDAFSKLQYESVSLGSRPSRWGFEVENSEATFGVFETFKLGLDPGHEKETKLVQWHRCVANVPSAPAEVEKLVVDYLTALREHLEKQLRTLPNEILESVPRQYIITVPAVWSDKAKVRTRVCAEKAKMGDRDKLQIIPESEAAAIYVLDEMEAEGVRFNIDDTFVVCDAGGRYVNVLRV